MLDAKSVACHVQACLIQNPVPGAANDNRFGCPSKFSSAPHPAVRARRLRDGAPSNFAMAHEHCYIERSALLRSLYLSGSPHESKYYILYL